MQQIGDWLKALGMSEYAERFAENRIDLSVLPDLTDQDLEKLGVLLGDRRKMLRAIAELNSGSKGTAKPATEAATVAPQEAAERRQVTVMFSDLVGSTAMSARMDPEDLREVISAYQKCVAETVRHFDGFVAKYMGDGVLVYFGYPQAHEDDAERAVRAGLELIGAVTALKTRTPLQTRVGIATGLVVVGDLIGSGASQERAIVGETPNLAARLQGIAEPNGVVIAEGTRRLLGNLFELADLGAKDLKGIAGPVRAFVALRASAVEGRFEAMHGSGLTDLVGREEELELLLRRWRAKPGQGQVVLLSGEAGIGKSRLGGEQPVDDGGIAFGSIAGKTRRTAGRRQFGGVEVILQRQRDAVQRAERRAGCALLVGFPRGFPDAIGFERYECPEIGTQGRASEQRIREALGSNLAVADRLGRLGNS